MNNFGAVVQTLSEKTRLCSWDETFECYTWTEPRKLLSGITKKLKECFYPRAPRPQRIKQPKRTAGKGWKRGKKGGTLVHEQLEEFVESAKKGVLLKDLDPRVQKIISESRARGWIIFDAEYCVGDKDLHLGTGVDLLCLTPEGQIGVIEVKTGFDSVQYGGPMDKRMKKPFNMMDVSPWSQHQLQLLTTVGLFEKMTGLQVKYAEVWVVSTPSAEGECTLKPWPLHTEIVELMPKILIMVGKRPSQNKKRKYVTTPSAKPKKR